MSVIQAAKIQASIVVPARNEEGHIHVCLDSLLNQSISRENYEVIVVDGNSTDATPSIVRALQTKAPNLKLAKNPAGAIPIGLNLGVKAAQADVIIIAGAHSTYPRHFVEKSIKYLEETGADAVGGPIKAEPLSNRLSARLNSVILSSRFGVGNSAGRTSTKADFVDSVFYGAYKRKIFDRVGPYNERLSRNEDNDLSARVRKAGGRIYFTPELTVAYHPATSFWKLFRKAFRDSKWHFVSVRENPGSMGLRHFMPLALLLGFLFFAVTAFFVSWAAYPLLAILGLHLGIGYCFALAHARKLGLVGTLLFPFACLSFHLAYGAGTLVGLFKFPDPQVGVSKTPGPTG